MEKLPDELLYEVLKRLSIEERILLRPVCRRWKHYAELSCSLARHLKTDCFALLNFLWALEDFGKNLRSLVLECLDHQFPPLRKLLDILAMKLAPYG